MPTRADRPRHVPDPDLPLWELVQTSHVVARRFHELFAAAGLTPTQFGVLAELARAPGADDAAPTQADLARTVLIRPQSMGELVAHLVERGLVERRGPAGRGRRSGLHITAAGLDALANTIPAVHTFNAPTTTGLTADESDTLTRLLRRVRHNLAEQEQT